MIDLSGLWPHQLATYEFGKDKTALLDASSSGSGKTFAHVKLIENFLATGGSRAIITCPKTLVRSAWLQEFTERAPDIKIALAEAPEDSRKAAFDSDADVVIINVDGIKWLANQSEWWLKNRLGYNSMLVNDESHALKNPQAQRTKAALALAPRFVKAHCMSGTMAPNSIVELWSQAKLVDAGARLGKRYTAFRNMMQRPISRGPFTEWVDKDDAAQIAYALLSDIMIRHSFDEVMKHVPDMTHNLVKFELSPAHRKVYDQLEEAAYLEHEGKSISAVNAAALAGKLLQCASGAAYADGVGDDNSKNWTKFDTARYELIGELCEARQHTVVFFTWKHQKEELIKEMKARKLSYAVLDGSVKSSKVRDTTVKDFQNGDYRVILMHPLTGAVGLTLTRATTTIFASPTYDAMLYEQGIARVRRGVQDKPTESIIVIAKDTRDVQAYQVFVGKRDRLDALNNLFERGYRDGVTP